MGPGGAVPRPAVRDAVGGRAEARARAHRAARGRAVRLRQARNPHRGLTIRGKIPGTSPSPEVGMRIEGGCHCGRVSYEAEADPDKAGICHCTDCQNLSGSPYVAFIPVPKEGFKLRGQPKLYVKTAASGNRRAQAVCPECGSRMRAAAETDPQAVTLRLGGGGLRAHVAREAPGGWRLA